MRKWTFWIMATLGLISTGCSPQTKLESNKPITKPEITIEGGRMTPEALWAMGRIGSATRNDETGLLAYTVSYYSVEENRSSTWIRICQHGDELKVLDEFVGSEPAWLGIDNALVYLRGGKIYIRQEGKDIEVTNSADIEGFLVSPKQDKIVIIKQVKTIPSTADKYADLPLASGHIHEDLMYKHWDEWTSTAPQPFVCDLEIENDGSGITRAAISEGVNILEGTAYESPMKPFGGVEQLAWNPNNEEIAYTCRKKTGIDYAISTNSDIYLYDIRTRTHKNITEENKGYDTNPSYSLDGSQIAWLSMERDGYESDENRLMVLDLETGVQTFLTKGLDTNVDAFYWQDDQTIIFNAVWHGTEQLYKLTLDAQPIWRTITEGQYDHEPIDSDEEGFYFLRHSMREANEIYYSKNGEVTQLTYENENIYKQIERSTVVPRWQKTSDGKDMLTWIIYPPHFDSNKKYATILYCEGGPQSPVSQFWSFRWNFMMMSAGDYIIVAPNRRGLPGFGMAWNEQISGDYGGQCMRDYFSAIDEFCNEPYVDKERLGCVGASFGGYSVYWIAGHHEGRFKAFIAHDGIFNMEMQYLETEEKWFANWDMGGAYWEKDNAIAQRTFANSPHKFVDKWDTPIL